MFESRKSHLDNLGCRSPLPLVLVRRKILKIGATLESSHFQAKIRSHTRLYFTVALIKNTECKWNLWIRRCNTFQTRSLTTKMMTFWNSMWASAKNWRESVEAAEWLSLQITTFTEGPKQGRDTSDATLETLQNQFWRWDLMPKDAKVTWWIVFFLTKYLLYNRVYHPIVHEVSSCFVLGVSPALLGQ